jgi:hypothetical protein
MGRQLMKMGRERMAEEAARVAEQLVIERQQRREYEEALANRSREVPAVAAVQRGLLNSIVGSLASENVTPYIDVQPIQCFSKLEAWTDFKRIHVRYHQDPDPRIMAAVLRGLMYHEGGHIRWTIPFPNLRALVGDTDDSNRTGVEVQRLQRAWNALEDQRMETAVVSDSPNKAGFFVPMVMTELLNTVDKATHNYPLLVWRRYLPKRIRDASRAAFVAVHGEAVTQDIEVCVDRYVMATTPEDMWAAVKWFDQLTCGLNMDLPGAADGHAKQAAGAGELDPTDRLDIPVSPSMEADPAEAQPEPQPGTGEAGKEEDEGQAAGGAPAEGEGEQEGQGQGAGEDEGQGAGEEGEGEGGDGEGQSDASEQSEGPSSQGSRGQGAGAPSDTPADHDPLSQEMLNEAIAQAEQDRYNNRSIDADVDAYNDALQNRGSRLAPYQLMAEENAECIIAAEALADDMVSSFNQATMDRVPSWVEGQRAGILNVGRYMTRQPGDMEYFRQWMDDDLPGYNLAVSVLLDYSGSMSSSARPLAQVGYATKVACDRLEIPCTVVLWDDDAKVLWDGQETAEMVPTLSCTGNTCPALALADLDNQRFGKARHLVLIMTDGVWSRFDNRSLASYANDGRLLMGIGYAQGDETKARKRTEHLIGYGCPDSYPVTNLSELPWLLEDLLLRMA